MAENETQEPRGFGEHSRGLAAEYAHEQGWGIDEEERTKQPEGRQASDGGGDYDYGARDFGDEPADTSGVDGKLEKDVEKAFGGLTQAGGDREVVKTERISGNEEEKEEGR